MDIFEWSKQFPKEETYSLTDQIRRSSRSVNANIGEAYRKRRCPKHFIRKLTDTDGESSETVVWLNYALACGYTTAKEQEPLLTKSKEEGTLINYMINYPEKFGVKLN